MNELVAADELASGAAAGPLVFGNSFLVAMRISGTGAIYRAGRDELAWREPRAWLSSEMQRRCTGLPLVVEHPESGILDADTFRGSVVGVIISTFVRGDELWGVARLFDRDVAGAISDPNGRFTHDTSPAVLFADGETVEVPLRDGRKLLVEGSPSLVDHLALCVTDDGTPGGAWSRGTKTGIEQAQKEMVNA